MTASDSNNIYILVCKKLPETMYCFTQQEA